jgi:thioesterase domain-containing protein
MQFKKELDQMLSFIPILEQMGVCVVEFNKDTVITKVPKKGNTNHLGTIYAGVIFSLAEFTGVPLMYPKFTNEVLYIMKDMSIRYRRPATTDLTVTATFTDEDAAFCRAELDKEGKVDFLIEMEVKDETGEVVALTKNLYHLRKA